MGQAFLARRGNNSDTLAAFIERTATEFYSETAKSVESYVFYKSRNLKVVHLPAVTEIAESAFECCYGLEKADFPSVTSIGQHSFDKCYNLTTANFPLLTYISPNAFYENTALASISFPLVTSIDTGAFYGCASLSKADFAKVKDIGQNAFRGCAELTALIIRTGSLCSMGSGGLDGTPIEDGDGWVYVPKTLSNGLDGVAAYTNNMKWSNYAGKFRAIEDYPEITGG